MTEFAMSVPLILILLMGTVGLAFVLFSWVTLYHASNEGVSYVLRHPINAKSEQGRLNQVEKVVDEAITPSMFALFADGTRSCRQTDTRAWECTYSESPDTLVRISTPGGLYPAVTVEYEVPLPTFSIPLILNDDSVTVLSPIPISATGAGRYD